MRRRSPPLALTHKLLRILQLSAVSRVLPIIVPASRRLVTILVATNWQFTHTRCISIATLVRG